MNMAASINAAETCEAARLGRVMADVRQKHYALDELSVQFRGDEETHVRSGQRAHRAFDDAMVFLTDREEWLYQAIANVDATSLEGATAQLTALQNVGDVLLSCRDESAWWDSLKRVYDLLLIRITRFHLRQFGGEVPAAAGLDLSVSQTHEELIEELLSLPERDGKPTPAQATEPKATNGRKRRTAGKPDVVAVAAE